MYPLFFMFIIELMLAKKKILCYNVYIQRKREKNMKKTNQKTEQVVTTEQVTKLQPFPFIENEDYLLKLKSGSYAVAYWNEGQFFSEFSDQYVEEEIVGIVALKDLGL